AARRSDGKWGLPRGGCPGPPGLRLLLRAKLFSSPLVDRVLRGAFRADRRGPRACAVPGTAEAARIRLESRKTASGWRRKGRARPPGAESRFSVRGAAPVDL